MYLNEPLNAEMIKAGADLTGELDKAGLAVKASFWFYMVESQTWRMIIASPRVSSIGPKIVYQKVQKAISKLDAISQNKVSLQNVSVVENNHPIVNLLRMAIQTGNGINGIRFSNNTINGQFIEDAYIYRLT